jgi:bacterial/archaeal transporter family protein
MRTRRRYIGALPTTRFALTLGRAELQLSLVREPPHTATTLPPTKVQLVTLSSSMEWFFWALLSALFAGATAILAKIGVADVNSNLATAIRTSVILVFSWGIAIFTTTGASIAAIDKKAWIMLVLSGLATGLSWLCYFRALQVGEVSKVAPIDKLSVVVAIGLGMLILREKLDLREGIGAALIVVGALVLALK